MTDPDDVEGVETEPIVESDDRNDPDEESETETGRDDEIDDPAVESGIVSVDVDPPSGDEPDDDDEIIDETETDIEPIRAADVVESDDEADDVSRPAGNGSDG